MSELPPQLRLLRDFYYGKVLKLSAAETLLHAPALVGKPSFFTLEHLQRHLSNPLLTPSWFSLTWHGQPIDCARAMARKPVQKGELAFLVENIVQDYLSRGASISLLGIEFLEPSINALCAAIDAPNENVMSSAVASFSQPAAEERVDVDNYDMLAIQTFGEVKWRVTQDGASQGQTEITTSPGDALFLRHGTSCTTQTVTPCALYLAVELYEHDVTEHVALGLLGQAFDLDCANCYSPAAGVMEKLFELANSSAYTSRLQEAQASHAETRKRGREMIAASRITHLTRLAAQPKAGA